MRAWAWAVLAVAGFLLMLAAYGRWMNLDPDAPYAAAFLCIGSGEPAGGVGAGTTIATRLRFLPLSEGDEAMVRGIAKSIPGREPALRAFLRRKLIELPALDIGQLATWLTEGRIPVPGKDEALGGSELRLDDELTAAGRTLKVVGVLRPSVSLFTDAALVSADPANEPLFAAADADVSPVRIIRLSAREFQDRKLHGQLEKAFPAKTFVKLAPNVHTPAAGYYTYLAGMALFLLGGTGVLIAIYRGMARGGRWPILAEPLAEIVGRPRLFWGIHLVYFGLYFLGSMVIHENPALQAALMSSVQQALTGEGPLGAAGKAYGSGSIPLAAAVTFVVNFFLGALAVITLPSMIIPGSGVLVAVFRAVMWGLLLGPASTALALAMLPHSGTLLLEGEGYILAAFFALLIPIRLFGKGQEPKSAPAPDAWPPAEDVELETGPESTSQRFRRAVGLNLKGLILVALVLAVAAIYEAIEVIRMAGL